MGEGPDLDLGAPIDPDEDSDSSAIYVQGLNNSITFHDLVDFCKQCGLVKSDKRTEQPMIHIYLNRTQESPEVMLRCPVKVHYLLRLLWSAVK